ncbi:MAG: acetate/propionate family kinase [Rhodoferax sp.]|uniref:acetate/propionate family kinase n=1 Tax=Rhodoferax sp. TaxID=50421 RepID=UPI00326607BC
MPDLRRSAGDTIVVLNAGSSSIKFAAFACDDPHTTALERLLYGEIDGMGKAARLLAWAHDGKPLPGSDVTALDDTPQAYEQGLQMLFQWLRQLVPGRRVLAVGHRVVHGGVEFVQPVCITPEILERLDALSPLAPLHQPHNLAAIRVVAKLAPTLLQIASFDTAFHAGQDWVMQAYALPQKIRDAGVKRYGFHGLSYEYIASVLPTHLGLQADARVVVAHLGNGASMCAMRERRSIATTMGFTALDGLMMGTRCGNLDPGVVLYLQAHMGMSPTEVENMLYRESGLLGVSGISSDMRLLEASNEPWAQAAIDLYVNRIARELGSLAATLGGLDALVFTAGIGEHSASIRRRICRDAQWLGVDLDADANEAHALRIGSVGSRVSVWTIPTNEELMLAQHALALVQDGARL